MFVQNDGCSCLWIFCILILLGCDRDKQQKVEVYGDGGRRVVALSHRNSGYLSGGVDWDAFFSCYQDAASDEKELLKFSNTISLIKALDERKLPKSYRDFVKRYAARGGTFIGGSDIENIGFFNPTSVLELKKYNPELLRIDEEWKIESEDEKYFLYGIDQDTAEGRFSYLESALVIGRYGESVYELILLYPESVTLDGEFEASILSHSYEFRAPSFAEMLRQLAHLFEYRPDLMPPYAQQDLERGCSKMITLRDVWWK